MGDFKSCPVCREQSDQCLSCASYVVEGERIYYEKLKDFGATKDHEVRFINRIQKHCTTAFFHNGELYIPSRQGRSVPLAIGLQWNAWQEQQAIINDLKAQLENMEQCYIEKKKQVEGLQKRIDEALICVDQAKDGFYGFSEEGGDTDNLAKHLEKALRGEHE